MTEIPPASTRHTGPDDGLSSVREEIQRTDSEKQGRSWLRQAVDAISSPYHRQDTAYNNLLSLTKEQQGGTPDKATVMRAVEESQQARQREQDAYNIAGGAIKAIGMFTPGRAGFWLAGSVFAADEVKTNDFNMTDVSLGATKGWLERYAGLKATRVGVNPALSVLALGPTNRAIDTALSSRNYLDDAGNSTFGAFGSGILRIGENALNPRSIAADVAVAGAMYPFMRSGLSTALAGNQFRKVTATSMATGYAGGLAEEINRQETTGQYSGERLALYPLARAVSSTVASLPGAQRQYVKEYPFAQAERTRELEYKMVSIAPSEVQRISRGGTPVTVRPLADGPTLGAPETVTVKRETVPQDWFGKLSRPFERSPQNADPQIRIMSRPFAAEGQQPQPWSMVIQPGFKTVADIAQRHSATGGMDQAKNLRAFAEPTVRYLGSGAESGAFLLANGTVLKATSVFGKDQAQNWGTSPLDARLLHKPIDMGKVGDQNLLIYQQEIVRSPVTTKQAEALREEAPKRGWWFSDYNRYIRDDQVSYAEEQAGVNAKGQVVFNDYGARSPRHR